MANNQPTIQDIERRRPLEAAAIARMTPDERLRMLEAMERGFGRCEERRRQRYFVLMIVISLVLFVAIGWKVFHG